MENELRFAGWLIRRIGDEISVCAPEATPGMVHVKNKGSLVNRLLYALSDALLTSDQSLSARASAGEGGDAILSGLLDYIDAETCTHEETHRGGAIWTICDGCDRKWADDEGGFVPHEDAPAVAAARKYLAAAPQPAQAGASGGGVDEKHLADCLLMTGHLSREQAEEVASKLRAFVLTPASPATDHCTCPSETRCAGTCPYYQRLHTTPPAHGDGELPPLPRAVTTADFGRDYYTQMREYARLALTTRPTPEAQEARDAVQWAHDEFEDKEHVARVRGDIGLADYYGVCKAKMAAALALPAQGEGS